MEWKKREKKEKKKKNEKKGSAVTKYVFNESERGGEYVYRKKVGSKEEKDEAW